MAENVLNDHGPIKGTVFDIKRYAIHDGPGIRTTVFMKGCPLECWWCHNPEGVGSPGLSEAGGELWTGFQVGAMDIQRKARGYEISVVELVEELEKDKIFYEESGGGVTFSGGEPLMQPEFLDEALKTCKGRGLHTTVDTSGHAPWEVLYAILDHVDLFYYDLKLMDDGQHVKYTGFSNSQALENLGFLDDAGKQVIVRFPVIPGITDSEENVGAVAEFVASLRNINKINLLAYHETARGKYEKLGLEYRLGDLKTPSEADLGKIKIQMEKIGLVVTIGG